VRVTLVRHGIAIDHAHLDCPTDELRALTERGQRRTRAAMEGLEALGIEPDLILTSPLVRAQETAVIAAQALDCPDLRESDALRGGVLTEAAFELLAGLSVDTVMLVGHAPHLDLLLRQSIGELGSSVPRMKKASAACIAFEEVALHRGELIFFHQPRALRELGRG
jgi:phosphohistidine phosphatase